MSQPTPAIVRTLAELLTDWCGGIDNLTVISHRRSGGWSLYTADLVRGDLQPAVACWYCAGTEVTVWCHQYANRHQLDLADPSSLPQLELMVRRAIQGKTDDD